METRVFLIQCAIAVPIIVGLTIYVLVRWDRSPLHRMMVLLLASIAPWLGGQVLKMAATDPSWRLLGLHAEQLSCCWMGALFLLTMGQFARLQPFTWGRPISTVLACLPVLLSAMYLTDPWHHAFYRDLQAALDGAHPDTWGGPVYWAIQIWAAVLSWSAVTCLGIAVWRGRTRGERRRPLIVLGAVVAPCAAHAIYVLGLQPFSYSLAPLALGGTAALFVYGVEAYGVLEAQPIVRADVLEHLHDALVLADAEGSVLDANAAAELVLGSERRALRGQRLEEVLALVATPEVAHAIGGAIALLEPGGRHLDSEFHARDGRIFELTSASVRADGSQPAGVFLSLRDRSEQRRTERLLRERQKLESVGILAAGVAHEVNNPLAFVRANLAHLQSLSPDLEKLVERHADGASSDLLEMPEILGESLEGIERISRIVESMLRLSRSPDEGSGPVDLNQLVLESIRLADLHRDRDVRVESRLEPGLPPVRGSADRLVQVLLNLLLNGKQALCGVPDAHLVAETGVEGGFAVVHVRDNGPGIAEANRSRVFDPFFTTRAPDEGTGLGLSIAFDIVREHDGVIEVDSKPGQGTCFTVRLPLEASGARDPSSRA